MFLGDTVKFTQVALGLVPKVLDAVDVVFTGGKELGMIDPQKQVLESFALHKNKRTDNPYGYHLAPVEWASLCWFAMATTHPGKMRLAHLSLITNECNSERQAVVALDCF